MVGWESLERHETLDLCFVTPHTRSEKRGSTTHSLLSVCHVHQRQFIIDEQLDLNLILYFKHESENKAAV